VEFNITKLTLHSLPGRLSLLFLSGLLSWVPKLSEHKSIFSVATKCFSFCHSFIMKSVFGRSTDSSNVSSPHSAIYSFPHNSQ